MNAEKTGTLIKELRKEKGFTQKEFADTLHVTDKAISKWETGRSMPDLAIMQSICEELNISLSELLSGERGRKDMDPTDSASLIMELVDREKAEKVRKLNGYFAVGLVFLLSGLVCAYLQFLDFDKFLLLTVLGILFELLGFYQNNRNRRGQTFTTEEMEVLTKDEKEIRMKTAEEMLLFARKCQKAEFKQYKLAFEEIAGQLEPDEYAVFSLVGEDYTVNDSPGPWHVAAAITDKRVFIAGETVRGRLLTRYVVNSYGRSEILSIKLINRKLVLKTANSVIKIQGENLAAVMERMSENGYLFTDASS